MASIRFQSRIAVVKDGSGGPQLRWHSFCCCHCDSGHLSRWPRLSFHPQQQFPFLAMRDLNKATSAARRSL